jgi:endo-1,3(4)-beta-glucanase
MKILTNEYYNENTPLNKHFHFNKLEENNDVNDVDTIIEVLKIEKNISYMKGISISIILISLVILSSIFINGMTLNEPPIESGAWSSIATPFATVDPRDLGLLQANRPQSSKPGRIFDNFRKSDTKQVPLPTNSWCENFFLGFDNVQSQNKVFQLPYIIDTAGIIPGIRTHSVNLEANDMSVEMVFDPEDGFIMGGVESFDPQHKISYDEQFNVAIARLSIVLEWETKDSSNSKSSTDTAMRSPIVRGSAYTTMEYISTTPRLYIQRHLASLPVIDNNEKNTIECGNGKDKWSKPFTVNKELKVHFVSGDATWLIFVSSPTEFVCSNVISEQEIGSLPGVVPPPSLDAFELRATRPIEKGVIRIALGNNCTTGINPKDCRLGQPNDNNIYMDLLRKYSEFYPTGFAEIGFTFPSESKIEEELGLNFNWAQVSMTSFSNSLPKNKFHYNDKFGVEKQNFNGMISEGEILMFGIPHHQERLRKTSESNIIIYKEGCIPTLHGQACPISGKSWSQLEHLHDIGFSTNTPIKKEMQDDLNKAIKEDIHFKIPINYMNGAGDTYFSGKMLAKLARIILIADETKAVSNKDFNNALNQLQSGVEIWLNGSAKSPLLFDESWGGVVMCGCTYIDNNCANSYPDCPALTDVGVNFGAGFYNDHHYHYGYHIYAAAVVSKFNPDWMRKYHEHVLLLIRDIANPSTDDPFFPVWRHKDFYLGFSWASGIVTQQGMPNPNGRNEESSSEAIAAYEAVALYGDVANYNFDQSTKLIDKTKAENAKRIRDMGRLLLATEIRSANTYWHVSSKKNVNRIYPEVFKPKIVGMMWSMLAQQQTWFGNQPWKSYGIQLMPLTVASEQRDNATWVKEMLPLFNESCSTDPICKSEGWSVLVEACRSTAGDWKLAWKNIMKLPDSVYISAGGNGHSKTNTLWFIATRPDI